MKKTNSINYGGKVLGIGLMSMLIVPGILICFAGLLLIEFQQDRRMDNYKFLIV